MDFDASRRGGFLVGSNGNFQLVLEPAPDVAVASVVEFITKAKVKEALDAEQTTRVTESLTELGKRTSSVMLLRESLFRLNQLSAAGKINESALTNLFFKIVSEAGQIAKAEIDSEATKAKAAEARAAQANAAAEKSKAKGKENDVIKTQIQQIETLELDANKKAQMIQKLKPVTE